MTQVSLRLQLRQFLGARIRQWRRYVNEVATVGPSDDTHTMIKSGIKPGESIIVGPFKSLESLQNGQAVKSDGSVPAQPSTGPATSRETKT